MNIIRTSQFNRAYKKLKKLRQLDVLSDLNDTILKLSKLEITTQKSNHPLVNQNGIKDIHIRPNIILLYRYDADLNLIMSLELINIVNHDSLNRKLKLSKK